MKTRPAYLVVDLGRTRPAIVRVTQSWPALGPEEIAVRVALDIADSLHPVHEIEVDIASAVIGSSQIEPPVEA